MQQLTSAVLVLIVVAACRDESVTAVRPGVFSAPSTVAADRASIERPMTGRCELRAAAPPIVTPPLVQETDIGKCELTGLGRTSFYGEQVINLATRTQNAPVMIFTAANGDELHASNVGSNTPTGPTTIAFTGTTTISGGTGQFANARGKLKVEGTANVVTSAARMTFTGSLALPVLEQVRR